MIDLLLVAQSLVQVWTATIGGKGNGIGPSTGRHRPLLSDDETRVALCQVDEIAFATSAQIDPVEALGKFADDTDAHVCWLTAKFVTAFIEVPRWWCAWDRRVVMMRRVAIAAHSARLTVQPLMSRYS